MSQFGYGNSRTTLRLGGGIIRVTSTGDIEITPPTGGSVVISGKNILTPSATQVVVAGTTIQPTAMTVPVSAAGLVTLTSTPTIAAGTDGQLIELFNVGSNAITFQANALLAGSTLRLVALTTLVLAALSSVRLRYVGSISQWVQCSGLLTAL